MWFNKILDRCRNRYLAVVGYIARKVSVIALILGLLVFFNLVFLKMSNTSFIPAEDQGVILTNIQLPEGASRTRTEKVIQQIIPLIKEEEGVKSVMDIIGFSMLSGQGENVGFAVTNLKPWNERTQDADYSTNILYKQKKS